MKIRRSFVAAFALVALTAATTRAETIMLPPSPEGSEAILLGTDSVAKELKLTSLQQAVIGDLRNEYRDEARAIVAETGDSLEAKKASQSKLDALQSSYDRRAERVLSADQKARLAEIELQIMGGYMLLKPSVQREVGVTKQQLQKIAVLWQKGQKYVSKVNRDFENGDISYNERIRELHDDRVDRAEDMLNVLTPDQRAKFEKLGGDKFLG